eukprot:gene30763-40058_t
MDAKYYIKVFEQSSELLIVIETNFIIVAASDSFLKSTFTIREDIVGRNIFDVFPDNPDDKTANGESIVRASFDRVIKNKSKDVLPVVKYDIPKPESEGGGFELKYWQATSSPILDENSNVKYIIHQTEDVTENKTLITQHEFDIKALKLLEDSEKRYNMMLMKSPFAFAVLKGKNMVINLANDSVKEMWGKGKDLEGKPLLEVLPELKDSEFPSLLHKVYTTGIPFSGDELLAPVFRNGKLEDVYFNFVYQPYLEADETISGVTVIAYEVTATVIVKKALEAKREAEQKVFKLVEESDKRYNMMLMNSPFTFAVLKGKDLIIDLANDQIKEVWGRGNDIEGKSLLEIMPELKNTTFLGMLYEVLATGIPFHGIEVQSPKNMHGHVKEEYFFNFVFQPYLETDQTISGITIIGNEVTEQVIAKNKLTEEKHNAEQKTKIAEAVVKAKQQFLSNMSHEIRTPMNSIVGFTNVVLKTDLNKEQKEFINAIKVSGDALLVLINDILDLAKVDAGKMTFEQTPFNLFDSISNMLHVFENKVQEKNLELIKEYDHTIPEVLEGDQMRLRQIILNLVSNAVKFTEKGKITLSILKVKEDEEKVTIEFAVTDTGIGIPVNKLEHIFEDFGQVVYEDAKLFGGTGLGLTIVKQLVEHQGGNVTVKSKKDEGRQNGKGAQSESGATLSHLPSAPTLFLALKLIN